MNAGDRVIFFYKNKPLTGVISKIFIGSKNYIIYNVKCGDDEYEISKRNNKIDEVIKL